MRIRENPAAAAQLITEANEHQDENAAREEGLHVSELTKCLTMAWAQRHGLQVFPTAEEDPDFAALLLAGQGHHAFLEAGEPERHVTIDLGEGYTVHGTIDRTMYEDYGVVPVEVKTTRLSASHYIGESYKNNYVEQLATYVLADFDAGDTLSSVAHDGVLGRLAILYLLGDYKGFKPPKFKVFDIWLGTRELLAWRPELLRRAKLVTGPVAPLPVEHFDWECEHCKLNVTNGGVCKPMPGRERSFFGETDPEWADKMTLEG